MMLILEKIAEILEELGYEFDYIWNSGDRVVVVKAYAEYNRFLFEAKDLFELLSILEKESDKVGCIWCRDS